LTLEAQITALLAEAEPLRGLDDDDPAKRPLAKMVERINSLRAQQALMPQVDGAEAWFAAELALLQPKRRGRPPMVRA
jgi:hypothetical protein